LLDESDQIKIVRPIGSVSKPKKSFTTLIAKNIVNTLPFVQLFV